MITITGLTTNVSENNSSVEACVNITQGSVNSSGSVYAYISTSASIGFNSAVGKTIIELLYSINHRDIKSVLIIVGIVISGIIFNISFLGSQSSI